MITEVKPASEHARSEKIAIPEDIKSALLSADATRLSLSKITNWSDNERALSKRTLETLNTQTTRLLEFRRDTIASGYTVEGLTVTVGTYYDPDNPDSPTNEVVNPFSNNKIFITMDNDADPNKPHRFTSDVHKLTGSEKYPDSIALIDNLLQSPDAYTYDTPTQYVDRLCVQLMQLNRSLDKTNSIEDPSERAKVQIYLRALRGRIGETLMRIIGDPELTTPEARIDIRALPNGDPMKNIWIQVGRNAPCRLKSEETGPSGITMFAMAKNVLKSLPADYIEPVNEPTNLSEEDTAQLLNELMDTDVKISELFKREKNLRGELPGLFERRDAIVIQLLDTYRNAGLPEKYTLRTVHLVQQKRVSVETYYAGQLLRFDNLPAPETLSHSRRGKMQTQLMPYDEVVVTGEYKSPKQL